MGTRRITSHGLVPFNLGEVGAQPRARRPPLPQAQRRAHLLVILRYDSATLLPSSSTPPGGDLAPLYHPTRADLVLLYGKSIAD